jgi:hypothetical protein
MKTVRQVNWAGPCIELGPLIRETAKFYVFQQHRNRRNREERISKGKVHLEPCTRCVDHPNTSYPNGYDL